MILNESTTECKVLCSSQTTENFVRKIEKRVLITTRYMCGEFKVDILHCVYLSVGMAQTCIGRCTYAHATFVSLFSCLTVASVPRNTHKVARKHR